MQGNRGRDTRPEIAVRSALHRAGLRYRVNFRPLTELRRTADIVFTKAKVAVFIDGCFWHGCPEHHRASHVNASYWKEKIATNKARDADTERRLQVAGWTVIRAWEHEAPDAVADRVIATVRIQM
ncbi:DNA mismatch endonuclease Vsr [Catenulispora acidiphila DSM 44928]|uniref:DNA mismatch endonuclease Vsr n=2 Tax=Catenulispora TaxID=414878 RepID=C7Q8S3_CATAD|nr:DNA mismatch endonuclease Vsr [Catenulispora acidiphila DSM 44928]